MFWTVNDGQVVDPRDIEETPDMFAPAAPPEPAKKYPTFYAVETQQEAKPCYLCSKLSAQFAQYGRYELPLHEYCWWVFGGGYEASKVRK